MSSFAELFCEHYGVAPQRYTRAVFIRCLHRRAWLFLPVMPLLPRNYFDADYQLISDVARLRSMHGVSAALADFRAHTSNLAFGRRRLKLRLSTRRVSHLIHQVMRNAAEARHIPAPDTDFAH